MYTPNPSKPGEVQEIENAIVLLIELNQKGRWNLGELERWLQLYPGQILAATRRLDEHFDEQYPPLEGEK